MRTRQSPRKTITLQGRCLAGQGLPVDVTITELSVGGCRISRPSANLVPGTRLQIVIGASGPYHARVKWLDKTHVGITFDRPLPDAVFATFQSSHIAETLAPSAQVDDFDDQPVGAPTRFC